MTRWWMKRRSLPAAVIVALLAVVGPLRGAPTQGAALDRSILTQAIPLYRPTALQKYISRKVADLISLSSFAKHPIDEAYSAQWFDEYFRQLDPSRMFFMASDIEDFRSYKPILGDLVRRRGNIDFAFEVYQRYLQRVQEWARFSVTRLEKPFDFTKEEVILMDRHDAPWCANRAELEDLWRRRAKNRLLVEILRDEKEAHDAASKTKEDDGKGNVVSDTPAETTEAKAAPAAKKESVKAKKEKADTFAEVKKTPVERAIDWHLRVLKRKLETEPMEIVEIFLSSLTRIYDPHSVYMAPDTQEDFDISMRLSLQGIGAVLTTKDSYVQVVEIVPGGPADRDGRLKADDRIIGVAQGENPGEPVNVIGMRLRKVVQLIRGPKGTTVDLTVLKAHAGKPVVIDIVRDKVELTAQEAQSEVIEVPLPDAAHTPGRIAVIDVPSFYCDFAAKRQGDPNYRSTTRDVRRLLTEAGLDTLSGVILDLRGNGGGALEEAIALAGLFIDKGPIVQVRDYRGRVHRRNDSDSGVFYGGPLIVLVDRFSASASEIVAAALQDYHRAVIVGEASTHGKGTVQTVYSLDQLLNRTNLFEGQRGGSLKFTIQKFYRVNGGSTQIKGVTPDIIFPSYTDHMKLGEARLPHVLPWDEIDALKVKCDVDVDPWIPELKRRSEQRRAASEAYKALVADIDRFGVRQARKTLTLNLQARRAHQAEEEAWGKKMQSLVRRRKRRDAEKNGKKKDDDEDAPDLVLEETVHIMADMVALSHGDLVATVETGDDDPRAAGKDPAKAHE